MTYKNGINYSVNKNKGDPAKKQCFSCCQPIENETSTSHSGSVYAVMDYRVVHSLEKYHESRQCGWPTALVLFRFCFYSSSEQALWVQAVTCAQGGRRQLSSRKEAQKAQEWKDGRAERDGLGSRLVRTACLAGEEWSPPAAPIRQHHLDVSRGLTPTETFVETLVPLTVVAPKENAGLLLETAVVLLSGACVVEPVDGSLLQPAIAMTMVVEMIPMMIAFFI